MTTYNFAAGPAVLPHEVLKKIQKELLNFNNSNMSILEISHRSALYQDVYKDNDSVQEIMANLENIPAVTRVRLFKQPLQEINTDRLIYRR